MTRHVTRMTIEDAEHYTPEERAAIIARYPAHERKARTQGLPQLGSGRVFAVDEDAIKVQAFDIPPDWMQIAGLDFGWGHPTGASRLAWDRDTDTIYVTASWAQKEATPLITAGALKPWGEWLPWAWPHDGLQHDKGSGLQLAAQYRGQGLKMLPERATFEDGTNGLEAGVTEMLDRMLTGRWKVFEHLEDWLNEFRLYHRKDGLIVKLDDDRICAARYAMMMKRFATAKPNLKAPKPRVFTGERGWML